MYKVSESDKQVQEIHGKFLHEKYVFMFSTKIFRKLPGSFSISYALKDPFSNNVFEIKFRHIYLLKNTIRLKN